MKKSITVTFWALVVVFIVIISEFLIPVVRELFRGFILFLLPLIVFFLLGIVLLVLTFKEKIKGKLKKFLILTGISATGFFISVFLHNVFYALGVITSHIVILKYLTEVLHVTFFIIANSVCPLGFLVGMVGSIMNLLKHKR